ncbi:MAG: energy transducer TonB, partial [Candidatus Mariimomonas ferrooxydans]
LFDGSSKIPEGKVLFVTLTSGSVLNREAMSKSGDLRPLVNTEQPEDKKSFSQMNIQAEKDPPVIRTLLRINPDDLFRKTRGVMVRTQTDTKDGGNKDYKKQGKAPDTVILAGHNAVERGVIDSSSNVFPFGDGESPGDKDGEMLSAGIINTIKNSIERVKTYPFLARKRGLEGTVRICFRVNPQGIPQNLKILKSSGYSILDTATLNIVKKAAPFPYVESPIELPVVFNLN